MNLRSSLLAISTLLGLGGCAPQPGEYVVIRLANATVTESSSCYPDNMFPEFSQDDRNTFTAGSTVALFAVDADTYIAELDNGAGIEGTRDGKDYSFSGEVVDVQETQTSTRELVVEFTMDNKYVSGRSVTTDTVTCTGDPCQPYSCKTTVDFVGSVLKGVDIERAI